jgi:chromosome segregation protein
MRIKRIEIIGFKSFCDRTVLNFKEPITGVVGPNGCGKSNIVDAIRWCMGEQSAKHLRGKAMDDVIFNGSDSRGPANMAEVSLTFEEVGFSEETLRVALDEREEEAKTDAALDQEPAPPATTEAEPAAPAAPLPGDDSSGWTLVADADAAEASEAEGNAAEGKVAEGNAAEGKVAEGKAPQVGAETSTATDKTDEPDNSIKGQADAFMAELEKKPSATEQAQKVLTDTPPAINFAEYSEVTISRRLFRDGTSNYFLNKTPCRLRDITDFFLGTGVGTKAYSIIEQGRVGMIVSSRPADRRHIIDEAAGITKFKRKKRAAERKLDQTRQNLLRVSDIVTELAKRLGSLRRQAQKAARYRRYKAEVKDIEMWAAAHKYLEYQAEDKMLAANLATVRGELEKIRAEYDSKDATVIAERAELAVEERRLSGLQEQIWELDNRIKLAESKVEYQTREAGELEERVSAAHGEIRSVTERREEARIELNSKESELGGLDSEISQANAETAERAEKVASAREALAAAQHELDEARMRLSEARSDLARAKSERESIGRRRDDASRRLGRVHEDTETVNARVSELEKSAKTLTGSLSTLKQTRLDLGAKAEDFERRFEELENGARECEAEVEMLRTELHRRKSRLQSLVEIHDKYEGFARGTRTVMQASAEVVGESEQSRIRGLVADVVEAPENLEIAVEAALGDRLGGILVESHEVGARAIEYLKDKSAGRSAFVPFQMPSAGDLGAKIQVEDYTAAGATAGAEGVPVTWSVDESSDGVVGETVRAPEGSGPKLGQWGEGVLGEMVDLVNIQDEYENIAKMLLGECVVVDTLDRALDLHQRGLRRTLVTLEGDVVDSRGVVAGGSRDSQGANVLGQKREIRELEEIVGGLESDLANATARFVSTKSELEQVRKTIKSLQSESHDGDIAITASERDLAGATSELERLRERAARLNSEQLELEARLQQIEQDDKKGEELFADSSRRIDEFEKAQLGLIDGVTAGQSRVEELAAGLTEAKVKVAQLGEKRASLDASILRLKNIDRDLSERLDKLETAIRDDSERSKGLRESCETINQELVGQRAERRTRGEEMGEGRNLYELRMAEMQVAEMAVRELRTRAEKLAGETNGFEIKIANLKSNLEHLEEGIADRYGLTLRKNLSEYHLRPMIGEEQEKRLEELKRLINRMGSDINLTAIEEFEEISQRHDFLSSQQKDLESAVAQLVKAITKINRTSRRLFRETFDAINNKFQEVFPRLFRGGRARLRLTGGDDVDILEAGVDIMAQPPGKKNATVDQLSGGEKALTAVALIFAIFQVKPSPFCLLDEVDAPLDDVNVDRYNEIVREMTDRSQFIVITHNKRTMEITDSLYGVTMQEPGVSKIVGVNLNKIDETLAA